MKVITALMLTVVLLWTSLQNSEQANTQPKIRLINGITNEKTRNDIQIELNANQGSFSYTPFNYKDVINDPNNEGKSFFQIQTDGSDQFVIKIRRAGPNTEIYSKSDIQISDSDTHTLIFADCDPDNDGGACSDPDGTAPGIIIHDVKRSSLGGDPAKGNFKAVVINGAATESFGNSDNNILTFKDTGSTNLNQELSPGDYADSGGKNGDSNYVGISQDNKYTFTYQPKSDGTDVTSPELDLTSRNAYSIIVIGTFDSTPNDKGFDVLALKDQDLYAKVRVFNAIQSKKGNTDLEVNFKDTGDNDVYGSDQSFEYGKQVPSSQYFKDVFIGNSPAKISVTVKDTSGGGTTLIDDQDTSDLDPNKWYTLVVADCTAGCTQASYVVYDVEQPYKPNDVKDNTIKSIFINGAKKLSTDASTNNDDLQINVGGSSIGTANDGEKFKNSYQEVGIFNGRISFKITANTPSKNWIQSLNNLDQRRPYTIIVAGDYDSSDSEDYGFEVFAIPDDEPHQRAYIRMVNGLQSDKGNNNNLYIVDPKKENQLADGATNDYEGKFPSGQNWQPVELGPRQKANIRIELDDDSNDVYYEAVEKELESGKYYTFIFADCNNNAGNCNGKSAILYKIENTIPSSIPAGKAHLTFIHGGGTVNGGTTNQQVSVKGDGDDNGNKFDSSGIDVGDKITKTFPQDDSFKISVSPDNSGSLGITNEQENINDRKAYSVILLTQVDTTNNDYDAGTLVLLDDTAAFQNAFVRFIHAIEDKQHNVDVAFEGGKVLKEGLGYQKVYPSEFLEPIEFHGDLRLRIVKSDDTTTSHFDGDITAGNINEVNTFVAIYCNAGGSCNNNNVRLIHDAQTLPSFDSIGNGKFQLNFVNAITDNNGGTDDNTDIQRSLTAPISTGSVTDVDRGASSGYQSADQGDSVSFNSGDASEVTKKIERKRPFTVVFVDEIDGGGNHENGKLLIISDSDALNKETNVAYYRVLHGDPNKKGEKLDFKIDSSTVANDLEYKAVKPDPSNDNIYFATRSLSSASEDLAVEVTSSGGGKTHYRKDSMTFEAGKYYTFVIAHCFGRDNAACNADSGDNSVTVYQVQQSVPGSIATGNYKLDYVNAIAFDDNNKESLRVQSPNDGGGNNIAQGKTLGYQSNQQKDSVDVQFDDTSDEKFHTKTGVDFSRRTAYTAIQLAGYDSNNNQYNNKEIVILRDGFPTFNVRFVYGTVSGDTDGVQLNIAPKDGISSDDNNNQLSSVGNVYPDGSSNYFNEFTTNALTLTINEEPDGSGSNLYQRTLTFENGKTYTVVFTNAKDASQNDLDKNYRVWIFEETLPDTITSGKATVKLLNAADSRNTDGIRFKPDNPVITELVTPGKSTQYNTIGAGSSVTFQAQDKDGNDEGSSDSFTPTARKPYTCVFIAGNNFNSAAVHCLENGDSDVYRTVKLRVFNGLMGKSKEKIDVTIGDSLSVSQLEYESVYPNPNQRVVYFEEITVAGKVSLNVQGKKDYSPKKQQDLKDGKTYTLVLADCEANCNGQNDVTTYIVEQSYPGKVDSGKINAEFINGVQQKSTKLDVEITDITDSKTTVNLGDALSSYQSVDSVSITAKDSNDDTIKQYKDTPTKGLPYTYILYGTYSGDPGSSSNYGNIAVKRLEDGYKTFYVRVVHGVASKNGDKLKVTIDPNSGDAIDNGGQNLAYGDAFTNNEDYFAKITANSIKISYSDGTKRFENTYAGLTHGRYYTFVAADCTKNCDNTESGQNFRLWKFEHQFPTMIRSNAEAEFINAAQDGVEDVKVTNLYDSAKDKIGAGTDTGYDKTSGTGSDQTITVNAGGSKLNEKSDATIKENNVYSVILLAQSGSDTGDYDKSSSKIVVLQDTPVYTTMKLRIFNALSENKQDINVNVFDKFRETKLAYGNVFPSGDREYYKTIQAPQKTQISITDQNGNMLSPEKKIDFGKDKTHTIVVADCDSSCNGQNGATIYLVEQNVPQKKDLTQDTIEASLINGVKKGAVDVKLTGDLSTDSKISPGSKLKYQSFNVSGIDDMISFNVTDSSNDDEILKQVDQQTLPGAYTFIFYGDSNNDYNIKKLKDDDNHRTFRFRIVHGVKDQGEVEVAINTDEFKQKISKFSDVYPDNSGDSSFEQMTVQGDIDLKVTDPNNNDNTIIKQTLSLSHDKAYTIVLAGCADSSKSYCNKKQVDVYAIEQLDLPSKKDGTINALYMNGALNDNSANKLWFNPGGGGGTSYSVEPGKKRDQYESANVKNDKFTLETERDANRKQGFEEEFDVTPREAYSFLAIGTFNSNDEKKYGYDIIKLSDANVNPSPSPSPSPGESPGESPGKSPGESPGKSPGESSGVSPGRSPTKSPTESLAMSIAYSHIVMVVAAAVMVFVFA